MTILELYEFAKKEGYTSMWVLIEFLVFEKKKESKLTFASDASELDFFLQERFSEKMNQYLDEYIQKRNIQFPIPYGQELSKEEIQKQREYNNKLLQAFEIVEDHYKVTV